MIDKKHLFTLALGVTTALNGNEENPIVTETTKSLIAATVFQQETIEEVPNLLNSDFIEKTDLQIAATENTPQQNVIQILPQNKIEISLEKAKAFNIEGLELAEGITFTHNEILYIVKTSPENTTLEISEK